MNSIQSPKAIAVWIGTTFSQFPDEIAVTDRGKQPTHNESRSRSVRSSSSLAGNGEFLRSFVGPYEELDGRLKGTVVVDQRVVIVIEWVIDRFILQLGKLREGFSLPLVQMGR
jgi:hypothetical protein